jgi:hypothetical protein
MVGRMKPTAIKVYTEPRETRKRDITDWCEKQELNLNAKQSKHW